MSDNTELKTAIEYILNQGALEREFIEDADALDAAWAVYEALGPTDILALIADIEDARNGMKHSCAIRLKKRIELLETQRDQLIADNERLTNRLEVDPRHDYDGISTRDATIKVLDEQVDQLKADNERLRADYAGLARFNPEWDRVAAAQDLVREHMAMVVQLKAEIAGLKTGYEAYERVNAELKAEVGALRNELKNLRSDNAQLIYALKQQEQSYLVLRAERDQVKADSEALRDDIEQSQYDANAWRDGEESVWIEVFHSEGDDPFISAISGQITVEQLALIQAEILEYRDDYFEKGSGLYVFRCGHCQAHYDNVGMTEPAHWETDFESYSPFPWEEEAALGQGEQS